MAGTGIWLSDQDLGQSGGAIWAQQQMQQMHGQLQAGQDWASEQMARLQAQASQQVQALAQPPSPAPAPVTPPPAAVPTPTPTAAPMPTAAPTPPPEPAPAPAPAPEPEPAPAEPSPSPSPLSGMAQAGQDWAQQQIQNLLGSSATPSQSLAIPGLSNQPSALPTPSPAASTMAQPLPIPGVGDQTATQSALGGPTATSAPQTAPTPSPSPQAATSVPGAPSGPQPAQPGDLIDQARQAAANAGIDPDIFARQIQQESGFDPNAKSGAGALGIAQFMPGTAQGLGIDPMNAAQSLVAAAKLDAQNLAKYGGDWGKALAAYNAGGGNVDKYGGIPPFQETQTYVQNILGGAKNLVQNAGQALMSAPPGNQPGVSLSAPDAQSTQGGPSGQQWLQIAEDQLSKPYIWGSQGGRSDFSQNPAGFDCSGFVSYVMKTGFGVDLPAFTGSAYQQTRALGPDEQPRPGDVAFYNMSSGDPHEQHIALYIGNGQIIQAGGTKDDVNIASANQPVGSAPEFRRPTALDNDRGNALAQTQVGSIAQTASTPQALTMGGNQPAGGSAQGGWQDLLNQGATAAGQGLNALGPTAYDLAPFGTGPGLQAAQTLVSSLLNPATAPGPLEQNLARSVVGNGLGQPALDALTGAQTTGQNLLDQANSLLSPAGTALSQALGTAQQAPQSLNDLLNQVGQQSMLSLSGLGAGDTANLGPLQVGPMPQDNSVIPVKIGGVDITQSYSPQAATQALLGPNADPVVAATVQQALSPVNAFFGPLGYAAGVASGPGSELAGQGAAALGWSPEQQAAARLVGGLGAGLATPAAIERLGPAVADLATGSTLRDLLMGGQATGPQVLGGAQAAAINPAFARALGGGALGGLAANQVTDPNDPNRGLKIAGATGLGMLAAGPGLDLALQIPGTIVSASGGAPGPVSAYDWARGVYRGGIVSGLNTMADVAGNAWMTPAASLLTGTARDLMALAPDRAAGRWLGAASGMTQWTNNFLAGLSDALARPTSLSARAGPGLATLADLPGALHAGFQNATSGLIQSMERGAAAGDVASGPNFSSWMNDFQSHLANPTASVAAAAQAAGQRAGLQAPLGTLTQAMARAVQGAGPVGDALFPVYAMGMRIAQRVAEYSPVGLAGTALDIARGATGAFGGGPYRAAMQGAGSLQDVLTAASSNPAVGPVSERLTNNLLGTLVSGWLATKAAAGDITGSGPEDPKQHAVWLADGNQPDSFRGPDGQFYPWDKLPPQIRGPMMFAGAYADSIQAYNAALAKQGAAAPGAYNIEDPRFAQAQQLVTEVTRQLMSMTPARTLAGLYDTFQGGGTAMTAGLSGATNMASSVLGGMIPESGLVRSVAQMTDPNQRQPLYPTQPQQLLPAILQNLQENIPGQRETLPVRQDILGRPIPNPLQGLGEISPLHPAAGTPNAILDMMQSVGVAPSAAPPAIPFGPTHEITLTPDQRRQWEVLRGNLLQQTAGPLAASPEFQQMASSPLGQQAQKATLQRLSDNADAYATRMMTANLAGTAPQTWQLTGRLAPVTGYGPNVQASQQQLATQLALMRGLLGGGLGGIQPSSGQGLQQAYAIANA